MLEGIYFEHPKVWTILFIFLACEALCKMRERGIYYPHLRAFASVTLKPSYWLWFLKWLSVSLLITALMSPVSETPLQPESAPGHTVALVVDSSASMRDGAFDSADKTRSRFEVVQGVLGDFIDKRQSDALGLVVFGTHAFVASPPTLDKTMLSGIIDRLYVGIAGKYTALYEAVAKGAALLHETDSREKVLVLLTDGRNTPGAPVGADIAGALAVREGIRIYAIVIGELPGSEQQTLKTMAVQSGGDFFTAEDAAALAEVYARIDALEPSPQRPPLILVKQYYYIYPLFAGFLALLLYVYWRNRRVA